MSEPRTVLTDVVAEESTCRITAVVQDESGVALPDTQVTTLELTLYAPDLGDEPILNSRDAVNVKNANGGTLDASGNFVLTLGPADNEVLDRTRPQELHRALLVWTFAAGAKTGRYEVDFYVRNMQRVP